MTEVHRRFRQALSGKYLVVTFEEPREIETLGGTIKAVELLIGLNRPDHADSVFTVDPEGRVVEHGKFSGLKGIELMNLVKAINKPR